jgi:hypothetical protein
MRLNKKRLSAHPNDFGSTMSFAKGTSSSSFHDLISCEQITHFSSVVLE